MWGRFFAAVQQQANTAEQLDWDCHCVDGTLVRAHQHTAGVKKGADYRAMEVVAATLVWLEFANTP